MNKLFNKLAIITSLVMTFSLTAPVLAAPVPINFVSNISLSNPNALLGEKLTLTVQLQKIAQIKKTEIKIDDQVVVTCKAGKSKCTATLEKFVDADVGDHTFSIVITPKKGAIFKSSGTYTVVADADKDEVLQFDEEVANGTLPWLADWKAKNKFIPAKNDLAPELDRVSAPTFEPRVGKKWPLTAWAKNKSELLGMGVYIDEEEIPSSGIGSACIMCDKTNYPANSGYLVGPFTKDDIGEHSYAILLVGKNGQRRVAQGTFEVKP